MRGAGRLPRLRTHKVRPGFVIILESSRAQDQKLKDQGSATCCLSSEISLSHSLFSVCEMGVIARQEVGGQDPPPTSDHPVWLLGDKDWGFPGAGAETGTGVETGARGTGNSKKGRGGLFGAEKEEMGAEGGKQAGGVESVGSREKGEVFYIIPRGSPTYPQHI